MRVNLRESLVDHITAILREADVAESAAAATLIADAVIAEGADDLHGRASAMAIEHAKGRPLAYLTGQAPFMGLNLIAAPGALAPRVETELLGWTAVKVLQERESSSHRLIDMCCGSGNLVCGIAARIPSTWAWAADLTGDAVDVTRQNVDRVGLSERVSVHRGDLFGALAGLALERSIDVIVCNPPYISTGKLAKDRAGLLLHEPREAFDGGPYGVSIFQRVIRDAAVFLVTGGTLLFEIGAGQQQQVAALFSRNTNYSAPHFVENVAGEARVAMALRR